MLCRPVPTEIKKAAVRDVETSPVFTRASDSPLGWWLGAESFADPMRRERAVSARPS
jgi:hypothetical protein